MHKPRAVPCTQEMDDYKFDISSDGITYTPFCGNGDEKDLDCFIDWDELKVIFMETREMRKRS